MELSQLNYFRTVARFQNMSKAASQLYVTQSTLSQNLRKLEDELGVTLFTRRGKSLALNELGQVVLKYSDEIFALLEEMRKELENDLELAIEKGRKIGLNNEEINDLFQMILEDTNA